jgi:hypothetical protein
LSALSQTHLQSLDFGSTAVDDSGMTYLSKMDKLSRVDLNKTTVTIDGVSKLCKNRQIKTIKIEDCPNLGPEEIKKLRISFPSVDFSDQPDQKEPDFKLDE